MSEHFLQCVNFLYAHHALYLGTKVTDYFVCFKFGYRCKQLEGSTDSDKKKHITVAAALQMQKQENVFSLKSCGLGQLVGVTWSNCTQRPRNEACCIKIKLSNTWHLVIAVRALLVITTWWHQGADVKTNSVYSNGSSHRAESDEGGGWYTVWRQKRLGSRMRFQSMTPQGMLVCIIRCEVPALSLLHWNFSLL